jgi:hypothetical protein
MAMACVLLPASLAAATASTTTRASYTRPYTRRRGHIPPGPLSAPKMGAHACQVSEDADPQPLLRAAAGGHPRLRVRRPTLHPRRG